MKGATNKRKMKKNMTEDTTMIGKVIDLPFDKFVEDFMSNPDNDMSVLTGLYISLTREYSRINQMKEDALNKLLSTPEEDRDTIIKCKELIDMCYAEMQKTEDKVIWLQKEKERRINKSNEYLKS